MLLCVVGQAVAVVVFVKLGTPFIMRAGVVGKSVAVGVFV